MSGEKDGPQAAESHDGDEEERMSPLWAGRRPSGDAARRQRVCVMGEFGGQCCEGSARARPRVGWWVCCTGWRRMSRRTSGGGWRTRTSASRRRKYAPSPSPNPAHRASRCRSDDSGLSLRSSDFLLRLIALPLVHPPPRATVRMPCSPSLVQHRAQREYTLCARRLLLVGRLSRVV